MGTGPKKDETMKLASTFSHMLLSSSASDLEYGFVTSSKPTSTFVFGFLYLVKYLSW